jgi:hypothetical protein
MSYRMDGQGTGIQFLAGAREFSLLHSIRTPRELTQPCIQQVLGTPPPEIKVAEHEVHCSYSFNAKVKIGEAIPPLPHTSLWHGA